MPEVADPRHGGPLAQHGPPLPGAGHHGAIVGDAQPRAHARLLVHVLAPPRRDADLLDDLPHEIGHGHGKFAVQLHVRLLLHDLDAQRPLPRIVRVDHRADAVFQLRDHLAAAVVSGRVGREEQQHVDVEADRVAADLHVALFEDVEQAHLDQLVQLGQFVDREDAAVHAGDQPEVQGLLGRHAHAAGQLRRIDLADHVGELRPRRQPLGIAKLPRPPGHRHLRRRTLRHQPLARLRDRVIGVFVHRAAGNVQIGNLLIEKPGQQPHQPALALTLGAEKEQVVAGDQAQVDLRDDRLVVADDAGEEFLAGGEHAHEVVVDLPLDRLGLPAALAKFFEVGRFDRYCCCHISSLFFPRAVPLSLRERARVRARSRRHVVSARRTLGIVARRRLRAKVAGEGGLQPGRFRGRMVIGSRCREGVL